MHFRMNDDQDISKDFVYKTKNVYSTTELRYIYFIADLPQLLKTARNCLVYSGSGTMSRYVWNNGYHLLWSHVAQMFHDDPTCGLQLPKLTYDHIRLTSYSKMNVKLAAQVLSSTVGNTMTKYGSPDLQKQQSFVA